MTQQNDDKDAAQYKAISPMLWAIMGAIAIALLAIGIYSNWPQQRRPASLAPSISSQAG